ncbi:dipeptide epimerase [Lentibacillus cibarius]|uniref:Dipeptide epimerase n=1 Tax=Lentibacillus cibarius TaxID=2583219 RepID=A0A549YFX4_9BACI|nr:dipeptide epimerase [Lentibacillus cibarius]TRM10748.1 dipeptide epimerase [Lentibacillus cibarius]
MNIRTIETGYASIPLHTPFKTALRTVTTAETVVVKVTCDNGITGWGEAPPTHVITGDSVASIHYAVNNIIKPRLLGESVRKREQVFATLSRSAVGNTSAKAAVDMAIYDCLAQYAGMPLYQFLGGYQSALETDYTVSVNQPDEMAAHAQTCIEQGFHVLKVKVGSDDSLTDIRRIEAIREQVGPEPSIRLDANQGWQAKEAISTIRKMETLGLDIELIEQPVPKHDLDGMRYVTANTETLIMADESVFSAHDARMVLEKNAADLINIKLMKAGGIHEALKIAKLADVYGVECMTGSMIETGIGITAAAHFAASQPNVTRYDFDAPLMLADDTMEDGISYHGRHIRLEEKPGLGISRMKAEAVRWNVDVYSGVSD